MGKVMKILVAQQYGVGNAVMTTPLIKALSMLKHSVSCSYDERRAGVKLVLGDLPEVDRVYGCGDFVGIKKVKFDLLIPCGRLPKLQSYYSIHRAIYPFKDIPQKVSQSELPTLYKKHEIDYMMDAARELGYTGPCPHPYIGKYDYVVPEVVGRKVALGIGYFKNDPWSKLKHWGNAWYAKLTRDLASKGVSCFLVGGPSDIDDAKQIMAQAAVNTYDVTKQVSLRWMFGMIAACDCFVGNDTGLAHAAAALKKPTLTIFQQGVSSIIKNSPRGARATYIVEKSYGSAYDDILSWVCEAVSGGL